MRDKTTGRSRGFGFLTYEDMDSLDKLLESSKHELDGRTVEVKRAIPRGEVKTIRRKLFVGGVAPTTTSESLRDAFIRFGPIAEAQIMKDRMRGRSRGFGFVTFEDDESILEALGTAEHRVDGKLVDVKRAEPKKRASAPAANPLAHNYASPNSSPRGSLAFTSPMLGGYPMNFTLLPYPVMNSEFSNTGSNLAGYSNPGYADAPATYLFASPYASPRGSFAIGETDLPTDFAELSMGRRYSHDFASSMPSFSSPSNLDAPSGIYASNSQMPSPLQSTGPASLSPGTNPNMNANSASNGIPSLSLPLPNANNASNMSFQQMQQQMQQQASPRGADSNSANGSSFNSFYMPQYQQFQQLQQLQMQQLLFHQQQQQQQQQQFQSSLSPSQQRAFNNMRRDNGTHQRGASSPSQGSTSPATSSPTPQSQITSLNKEQEKEEEVTRSFTPVISVDRKTGRSSTPVPRTSTPVISAPLPRDPVPIASPIATRALDGKMGVDHHHDTTDNPRTSGVSSPATVPLSAARSTPQFA